MDAAGPFGRGGSANQRLQLAERPRTSVDEASERDFRIVLVEDALPGTYERGLAECRRIGARVADCATWLRLLAA